MTSADALLGHDEWSLPIRPAPVAEAPRLYPGLYLMWGPRAAGKTLTALALALWLKAQNVRANFQYILEPRSTQVENLLSINGYNSWLVEKLEDTQQGVLCIDSLTYTLSHLEEVAKYAASFTDATYPGGLKPKDVVGALFHDWIARQYGVALIGTLNSDLFPVVKDLEGATEGQLLVISPGVVKQRDRGDRTERPIDFPKQYVEEAAVLLGYTAASRGMERNLDFV